MGAGVSCEVFDGTLPPGTRHYLIEERFNPGTNQKTYAREFGTTSELRQTGTMTKEKALEWDAKAYDSRKTFHAFLTETLTDALMKKVQNREPIEVRKLFNPTQLRVGAAKSKRDCDAAQEKSDQAFESAARERDAGRTTQTTLPRPSSPSEFVRTRGVNVKRRHFDVLLAFILEFGRAASRSAPCGVGRAATRWPGC